MQMSFWLRKLYPLFAKIMLRPSGKPTDLEEISNLTFLDKLVMDNQRVPGWPGHWDVTIWPGFINRDKYLEIHQRVSLVTASQWWPGIIGIGTRVLSGRHHTPGHTTICPRVTEVNLTDDDPVLTRSSDVGSPIPPRVPALRTLCHKIAGRKCVATSLSLDIKIIS